MVLITGDIGLEWEIPMYSRPEEITWYPGDVRENIRESECVCRRAPFTPTKAGRVGLFPMLGAQVNTLSFDYHHPQVPVWPQKTKGKKNQTREKDTGKETIRENRIKVRKMRQRVKIALGEADGLKSRNLFGRCLSRKRYLGSGKKLLYLYS